jgi:hypothetical protein
LRRQFKRLIEYRIGAGVLTSAQALNDIGPQDDWRSAIGGDTDTSRRLSSAGTGRIQCVAGDQDDVIRQARRVLREAAAVLAAADNDGIPFQHALTPPKEFKTRI